ncbi:MAG: response regulator [Desulfopila sp.]|jgi:PAS domain S-box-containing protein|nr:response regulator [Desulfopila sp.]
MRLRFLDSLLWRLLLPIVFFGVLFSLILSWYLVPPLISVLEKRADQTITHTASMAMNICEERLNQMLVLRLEENQEMNSASKNEAIAEIIRIADIFPVIKFLVFDIDGLLQGSSFTTPSHQPEELLAILKNKRELNEIYQAELFGDTILFKPYYFPFWRWHIISFTTEKDYYAPIIMAQNIVRFGTFGTMLAVIASMLFLFLLRISSPLHKIIRATAEVRKGHFVRVNLKGNSEVERLACAFDHMIETLENERSQTRRMMDSLQESEEKYRLLTENSLTLVFVLHNDLFVYANSAAAAFFQTPGKNIAGENIYTLFSDEQAALLRKHLQLLLQNYSSVEHFELQYPAPDGEQRWLEIQAAMIPYRKRASILIHAQDITLRKKMEYEQDILRRKVSRSEQMEMLGTLAGGVAHDLNNIFGGIVSYPEFLLQTMDPADPLFSPLQTIHKSGTKAAAIVQDLLTLTRRGVLVTEIIYLQTIVEEYLRSPEFLNLRTFFPKIEVVTDFAPGLSPIVGSPHHIAKSLMNLVTNAAESMPQGGKISISLQNTFVSSPIAGFEDMRVGEYVTLTVQDYGGGISSQDLDKIFEPFYTKKVMGRSGTGLGMSVVWGTIKDHHGAIDIFSRQGAGTIITLYFPASQEKKEPQAQKPEVLQGSERGEKILVVDDVEEQRNLAVSILKSLGYTVDSVESGEHAVCKIKESDYDLVILDMIMDPGMDGLTTYRKILEHKQQQKAIIISGFSETERVRKAMAMGAGPYLRKPYKVHDLAAAVQSTLTLKRDIT